MAAPVGAEVKLYYDSLRSVYVGDGIRTSTGRMYLVIHVRVQTKGKGAGRRKHLQCVVIDGPEQVTGFIHPLIWYKR